MYYSTHVCRCMYDVFCIYVYVYQFPIYIICLIRACSLLSLTFSRVPLSDCFWFNYVAFSSDWIQAEWLAYWLRRYLGGSRNELRWDYYCWRVWNHEEQMESPPSNKWIDWKTQSDVLAPVSACLLLSLWVWQTKPPSLRPDIHLFDSWDGSESGMEDDFN